jgi:hypothetical protein
MADALSPPGLGLRATPRRIRCHDLDRIGHILTPTNSFPVSFQTLSQKLKYHNKTTMERTMAQVLSQEVWESDHAYPDYDGCDYDLLETIECPDHLPRLDFFDEAVQDRFCAACNERIDFLIEQSCDETGQLLPRLIWEQRLQNSPAERLYAWRQFFHNTDAVVMAQVAYFIYWFIRFERARRTGSAELLL